MYVYGMCRSDLNEELKPVEWAFPETFEMWDIWVAPKALRIIQTQDLCEKR